MFLGHFAVGLAAKRVVPQVSLGTLFISVQLVDLLWPIFLLLDWEHVRIAPGITRVTPLDFYDYPISHSLIGGLGWATLLGFGYFIFKRDRRAAIVLGLGVLSHWFLDLLMHRPDLPILPFSHADDAQSVGLGLWNSLPATLALEGGLMLFAAIIFFQKFRIPTLSGTFNFFGLFGFLTIIWIGNLFGPPPPSETMIAWAGNLQWLFVLWAYRLDPDLNRLTSAEG